MARADLQAAELFDLLAQPAPDRADATDTKHAVQGDDEPAPSDGVGEAFYLEAPISVVRALKVIEARIGVALGEPTPVTPVKIPADVAMSSPYLHRHAGLEETPETLEAYVVSLPARPPRTGWGTQGSGQLVDAEEALLGSLLPTGMVESVEHQLGAFDSPIGRVVTRGGRHFDVVVDPYGDGLSFVLDTDVVESAPFLRDSRAISEHEVLLVHVSDLGLSAAVAEELARCLVGAPSPRGSEAPFPPDSAWPIEPRTEGRDTGSV